MDGNIAMPALSRRQFIVTGLTAAGGSDRHRTGASIADRGPAVEPGDRQSARVQCLARHRARRYDHHPLPAF